MLADSSAADTTRAVALAWVMHLVGDIHQPLHSSSRVTPAEPLPKGDEGGNTFHLDDNRNLHAYWDRILDEAVAPEQGEDSIAYASRMARQIDRVAGTPPAGADAPSWAPARLRPAPTRAYSRGSRGSAPPAPDPGQALSGSD